MRQELISKMKNSASIEELNSHLIEFLNRVETPDEFYYTEGVDYVYSKTDTMKLFKMKKYNLYNYWSVELSKLGIPTDLSDFCIGS